MHLHAARPAPGSSTRQCRPSAPLQSLSCTHAHALLHPPARPPPAPLCGGLPPAAAAAPPCPGLQGRQRADTPCMHRYTHLALRYTSYIHMHIACGSLRRSRCDHKWPAMGCGGNAAWSICPGECSQSSAGHPQCTPRFKPNPTWLTSAQVTTWLTSAQVTTWLTSARMCLRVGTCLPACLQAPSAASTSTTHRGIRGSGGGGCSPSGPVRTVR